MAEWDEMVLSLLMSKLLAPISKPACACLPGDSGVCDNSLRMIKSHLKSLFSSSLKHFAVWDHFMFLEEAMKGQFYEKTHPDTYHLGQKTQEENHLFSVFNCRHALHTLITS